MMMTEVATINLIEQSWERIYTELRIAAEDDPYWGGHTYTWYAATLDELAEETGQDFEDYNITYIGDGEPIGWVWECNGWGLYQIGANATARQLDTLFRYTMGLED